MISLRVGGVGKEFGVGWTYVRVEWAGGGRAAVEAGVFVQVEVGHGEGFVGEAEEGGERVGEGCGGEGWSFGHGCFAVVEACRWMKDRACCFVVALKWDRDVSRVRK